jgi:hypothetical protein
MNRWALPVLWLASACSSSAPVEPREETTAEPATADEASRAVTPEPERVERAPVDWLAPTEGERRQAEQVPALPQPSGTQPTRSPESFTAPITDRPRPRQRRPSTANGRTPADDESALQLDE